MDIMHDFGEGVGVDMRDFPSHSEDDDVGVIAGTLNQVGVPAHPNCDFFPVLTTSPTNSSIPPHPQCHAERPGQTHTTPT